MGTAAPSRPCHSDYVVSRHEHLAFQRFANRPMALFLPIAEAARSYHVQIPT
jgi:hypothetical protein